MRRRLKKRERERETEETLSVGIYLINTTM